MKWKEGDPLPKIYCHVCGKVVSINADRGKHRNDLDGKRVLRFRFYCATCSNNCYYTALERGHVLHGWILAPRWFGHACVTLCRREQREA